MSKVGETISELAEWEAPEGTGVLSVYLDARAEASGERPAARKSDTLIRDRLNQIERTLLPRAAGLDSFRSDRDRIEGAIAREAPGSAGLAIFACAAANLFETVTAGTPFRTRVAYGPHAALYQLALLADEFETAVVAVGDTNTIRLFTVRAGKVAEAPGRDDADFATRRRKIGGMHEPRYLRHVQKNREDFASEAAQLITELIEEESATHLVLAGDAVAVPLLRAALPKRALDRLVSEPLAIDIRASRKQVAAEVASVLEAAEAMSSASVVDTLVGEVMQDDLGVAGEERIRAMLSVGAVDTLVLSDSYATAEIRDDLTRRAVQSGSKVEFVTGNAGLEELGGAGAILRFRPAWPV
ncbi:MAG: hypothetical protein WEC33_01445 [Dehalococcoidia bacterium]